MAIVATLDELFRLVDGSEFEDYTGRDRRICASNFVTFAETVLSGEEQDRRTTLHATSRQGRREGSLDRKGEPAALVPDGTREER